MSVQPYTTRDGRRYRVRWREGGKPKSRSFISKAKASAFDTEVKARKQRGEALPQTGRQTLGATFAEWWRLRGSELAPNTQATYSRHWNAHVKGRWDHYKLSEWVSNPQLFDELIADMNERGVGPASQRKVFIILSAVFSAAVEWRKVGVNPVLTARKPAGPPKHIPRPFAPLVVERIRRQMQQRKTRDSSGVRGLADAVMVELMAYAGLRPGEALALTWFDVLRVKTLAIEKAVALGELRETKTGGVRTPPLLQPLADDLSVLYIMRGEPPQDELVLPAPDGGHWSPSQYNNWRSRVWRPVMKDLAAGDPPQPELATARPYDCRSSFVSLQLRADENPLEIAEWTGHSPKVMWEHYAGVIAELKGQPRIPAVEQIEEARKAVEELAAEELDKMLAELMEGDANKVMEELHSTDDRAKRT
jgi:integrase